MRTTIHRPASAYPFSLQVELTSDCNLHCVMCPLTIGQTASGITRGHIRQAAWEEVKALAAHAEHVFIAGFGEPLVNKRSLELMRELDELGVNFTLTTNAHALTADVARQMVAMSRLVHINISIDSPDPEIYDHIRGGPLDRALRGVRNLVAASPNTERITVSSVLMAENLPSLVDFPALLASLGVRAYIIQGLANYNSDDMTEGMVSSDLMAQYVPQIEAACRAHGVRFIPQHSERLDLEVNDPQAVLQAFYQNPDGQDVTRMCSLPWELPYIDKDGLVYPCCFAGSKNQTVLGDLRHADLKTIWQSPAYNEFRDAILTGTTLPKVCRNCQSTPIGQHPMRLYSARIVPELSRLSGAADLLLVVENTGEKTWTSDDSVFIGTVGPRIRTSQYQTEGWLHSTRICSFREDAVPPGGTASFAFTIKPDWGFVEERFQLVVERKVWLPNTEFRISYAPPGMPSPTLSRSVVTSLTGTKAWRPTAQHDNGAVIKRLTPPVGSSLEVRPPMVCVDTAKGRYSLGERVPAGVACTIWFDRPLTP
ncbi:MAG: radical SAM protein [Chloroflexales bacterium]